MSAEAAGYRPDIDGLRAVAVLLVVAFHLDVKPFSGGYVGVDVFFVISGFLITRIVVAEIACGHGFSFRRFFVRRLRRLFPALAATVAGTLSVGSFILSPALLEQMSASAAAAILSVSNVVFWMQSGYFDTAALLKPLLHTWSLGVEEQFYLVWPPLILALWVALPPRAIPWALGGIGAASLAAAHWALARDPSAAFYLMPFRVYEFVIGALLVWLPARALPPGRAADAAGFAGLAMIFAAAVLYGEETDFPGVAALLPCAGTGLVIAAGQGSGCGRLLGTRPLVRIGLISYSLYLVHWPLIVLARYHEFGPLSALSRLAVFICAVALAALMYRFVERPFRRPVPRGAAGSGRFVTASAVVAVAVAGAGLYATASGGLPWRMPEALSAEAVREGMQRRLAHVTAACRIAQFETSPACNREAPVQVLILGDSHEPDAFNAFHALYGENPSVNLISFGTLNNCRFRVENGAITVDTDRANCKRRLGMLEDPGFLDRIDVVVAGMNWPFTPYAGAHWDLLRLLKARNERLMPVVIGGYLTTRLPCAELINRFRTVEACRQERFVASFEPDESALELFEAYRDLGFLHLDKVALFCPGRRLEACETSAGGVPFAYDQHHLSLEFAQEAGRRIGAAYAAELEALGLPPRLDPAPAPPEG